MALQAPNESGLVQPSMRDGATRDRRTQARMASFQSMQLQPLDLGPRAIDHADTQLLDDLAIRRRDCACSSGPVCSTASVASKTDSSRRAIRTRARRQGTPAAASACASSRCGRAYGQCIAWHRTARSPTWPSPWAASRQRLDALRISQRGQPASEPSIIIGRAYVLRHRPPCSARAVGRCPYLPEMCGLRRHHRHLLHAYRDP